MEHYSRAEADVHFEMECRGLFETAVVDLAGINGIKGDAFYHLLEMGVKPYEKIETIGGGIFGKKKKVLRVGGSSQRKGEIEVPEEKFKDFITSFISSLASKDIIITELQGLMVRSVL